MTILVLWRRQLQQTRAIEYHFQQKHVLHIK